MLRDARIRLEGRLEVLERAVATMREAIAHARRGEFRLLGVAMDLNMDATRAQIARLAPHEPGLERLQCTWVCLQAEAATVVRARARLMSVPAQPVKQELEALLAEPVRYEGAARHELAWLAPVAILLFTAFEVTLMRHPAPLIMHGGLAVYLAVSLWRSPRLRVTNRRVFVGNRAFELSELKGVEIESLLIRSTRPYRLTATLQSGARVEVRLPHAPQGFIDALRESPLAVSRKGVCWF